MSPQCSSWLMMRVGHSKRTRDSPEGDLRRSDVLHGNHAAEFASDTGDGNHVIYHCGGHLGNEQLATN
eukprot:5302558-Pyramimonas_sp.AAC.1